MKLLLTLFFYCFLIYSVVAQSKEETEVAAAMEVLRKAMIDPDKITLDKILSDHLSYGHSGGKVEDKNSFIEALTSGKSDFITITLSEQTIRITEKTAIVRHQLNGDTNDGGKPNTIHLAVMQVWHKQKNQWTLLARQAIKLQ